MSLDAAGRRELARLIAEEGLSPGEAAARLGIEEPTARAWVRRWHAADEASQRFAAFALRDEPAAAPAASSRRIGAPSRRWLAGIALVLAFVPVGWLLTALIGGSGDSGPRTSVKGAPSLRASGRFVASDVRAARRRGSALVAHVPGRRIRVYRRPRKHARHHRLPARRLDGRPLPLVLLVERRHGRKWLQVQLPTRPNLSRGWIRAGAVRLTQTDWRVRVDLSARTVTTWRGKRRISVHPIGVGASVSPTPRGRYYVTDLVKPPKPDGLYGAYAFGLSAHSNVLTSFGAGDGQIGLHGTNDASSLGRRVSHGCIRVSNDVIRSFKRHFPLGTPVTIRS